LFVAALAGVAPPWEYHFTVATSPGEHVAPVGRAFLFDPPTPPDLSDFYVVRYQRLFMEWAIILLTTGAVTALIPNDQQRR
jgi:hypothetical protein